MAPNDETETELKVKDKVDPSVSVTCQLHPSHHWRIIDVQDLLPYQR